MMIPARVAVFFLLACALLYSAPTNAKEKNAVKKEGNFFQKLRNKLINYIAKKKKFDSNGWVDLSLLQEQDENFEPIDLRIQDDKVICNANNQIMEVTVVNQKLLKHTVDASYHELIVHSKNTPPDGTVHSVIPLMKMKTKQNQGGKNAPAKQSWLSPVYAFPPNFEGYIVCTKKDTNALFVPKTVKPVQFVSGPWKVRVSINFYKCPLSNFGRIFQVTIIDQINILLNNEKSFIWPIPLKSFFEVYDFHLAVRECKKGNFCELEKTANGNGNNGTLILNCPSWGKTHNLTVANALLLSAYVGMAVAHGLSYPIVHKSPEDYLNSRYSKVSISTPRIHKRVIKSYLMDERADEDRKSSLKKLSLITNLLFLGGAGIANAAYGIKTLVDVVKNLNTINEEFENGLPFYPWELRYPQSYLGSQGGGMPKVEFAKKTVTSGKKVEPKGKGANMNQVETTYEMDSSQIIQTGNKQPNEEGTQHSNNGENDTQPKDSKTPPNENEPTNLKIFEQNIVEN
ncbi:Uncharacterized protein PCOAH_00054140 [Plasmodium coatneyi]|uniref:Parasitophorous vacuolar protein 2 n=1 Tax=Plasmodium coatneyi TaxID=208452 RepID=A0A1B1E795_9APIC|nr:Uncharacterized protein PCOAH_00054140 [Plasmodium coatneyi]ANQ10853.1 Uncharacterized protein PCOAH_00054140 [Plasmodium coatneyi]